MKTKGSGYVSSSCKIDLSLYMSFFHKRAIRSERECIPDVGINSSPFLDLHAAIHVVFRDPMRQSQRHTRVPAPELLHERIHVRQIGSVIKTRETIRRREEAVDLGLGASLDSGVEGHREEKRVQRRVRLRQKAHGVSGSGCGGKLKIRTVSAPPE